MPKATKSHPSDQQLAAFTAGKLSTEAPAVASHLEHCSECREKLARLPADSFVEMLRGAALAVSAETKPPLPTTDPWRTEPAGDRPLIPAEVPPELATSTKFEVLGKLGEGGMGSVWKARHAFLGCDVAIKVMTPDSKEHPGAQERFVQEMRAVGKLQHKHIVRAYDAEQAGGSLFIVMEYVEGTNLDQLVRLKGPLSIASACRAIVHAAERLQHAHERGMVHRDIKPSNLMVAKQEKLVKILDFGLARLPREQSAKQNQTRSQTFMGTPEYVAPEQATDARGADVRADIYSLGCTLYFLLAGQPPFVESTALETILAQVQDEPRPLPELRPEVTLDLWAVVAKMLAKRPEDRFQAPAEVARALAPFVNPGAAKPAPTAGTMVPEAKSTPAAQAAPTHQDPRSVWEMIGEVSVLPMLAQSPTPRPARKRSLLWPALAGGTIVAGLLAAWAGSMFKARTPNGTIVVENVPQDAEVEVNGEKVTVTRHGETVTLTALKDGRYRLKVVHGGKVLKLNEAEVTVAGKPVTVRVEPSPVPIPPPARVLAPEKSEWAGSGLVKIDGDEKWTGGAWTFTERRGQTFKALWRAGFAGRRAVFEGVVDSSGRVAIHSRQWTAPEAKPPEEFKGTGEVGDQRMTLALEDPKTGVTARIDFKRLLDGGESFNFKGRWEYYHRPEGWWGLRTVTATEVTTDGFSGSGPWHRDGGLIIVHFPGGGREALIIDPDKPNDLTGSNGVKYVTWVRR